VLVQYGAGLIPGNKTWLLSGSVCAVVTIAGV
jgi:hypothetical protein